ncbi:hypothetical protein BASA60_003714 [Batrachochytrium salamandrivorans]|nr:hypothetical protein BASA60_003714 [Batrachochytrium salamandrivorans]
MHHQQLTRKPKKSYVARGHQQYPQTHNPPRLYGPNQQRHRTLMRIPGPYGSSRYTQQQQQQQQQMNQVEVAKSKDKVTKSKATLLSLKAEVETLEVVVAKSEASFARFKDKFTNYEVEAKERLTP